jgi:hypothetical protein
VEKQAAKSNIFLFEVSLLLLLVLFTSYDYQLQRSASMLDKNWMHFSFSQSSQQLFEIKKEKEKIFV